MSKTGLKKPAGSEAEARQGSRVPCHKATNTLAGTRPQGKWSQGKMERLYNLPIKDLQPPLAPLSYIIPYGESHGRPQAGQGLAPSQLLSVTRARAPAHEPGRPRFKPQGS